MIDVQRGGISIWLASSIIILSTGILSHVMALPVILNIAGRDSWVSVIIAAPIYLIWIFIFIKLVHGLKRISLIDWIEQHWGISMGWLMKIVFCGALFFNSFYTMIDTVMWTNSTYLQQTPIFVIMLCFVLVCFFMAFSGLQSIAIVASILLPLVSFLGYFISFSNMKFKDYSLLFPIFDQGLQPPIHGSFYVLSSLFDVWIYILFAHHVKKKIKPWQLFLFGLFMLMIALGPIIGGITEFGPEEAMKQRHTAYDQWKILSLGQLLQHTDFLSIYQWLSGSITRSAISLYLMVDIFQFKTNKQRYMVMTLLKVLMIGLLFLPWRSEMMLYILQSFYFPALFGFVIVLCLAIGITQWILNRKESMQNEFES